MEINCTNCTKLFNKYPAEIKKTTNHFCSQSCAATYNNKIYKVKIKTILKCENCSKDLKETSLKYCSITCKTEKDYNDYILRWKQGLETGVTGLLTSTQIKKYMLIKHNHKCAECGWCKLNTFTNKIPLELEHIDGDYTNNNESNLTILCPNCHSLTATYKGANRNKGTRKR